jgi:predicted dehydrogenase
MLEAERRILKVPGYRLQWSYSDALARIKADMASGVLGRPLRMRSLILWPRPLSYYKRNSWAGAIKTASGIEINDSPLNNATAHYLHNCLYLLGSAPTTLQAECYRANKIENYDGVALRCEREGVEILFYSSHATRVNLGPVCVYEFERGTISLESFRKDFVVRFHDGSVKSYGDPEEEMMKKLDDCVEAARSGTKPVCRIGDALPHIRCVEAAKRSMPPVGIPASEIEVLENGGDPLTTVKGLPELFTLAFASGRLPSELGVAKWAKSGERSLLEK